MEEYLILVDENDRETGYGEKMEVHRRGLLHRAFSIFIFSWANDKMLLQRRAFNKYHSGGLWSNACCSHPRRGQSMEEALRGRLQTELGLSVDFRISEPAGPMMDGQETIYDCGSFLYRADFGEVSENELDHVFLYSPYSDPLKESMFQANPEEVAELRWVAVPELREWMARSPADFSAWFPQAFEMAYEALCSQAREIDLFNGSAK